MFQEDFTENMLLFNNACLLWEKENKLVRANIIIRYWKETKNKNLAESFLTKKILWPKNYPIKKEHSVKTSEKKFDQKNNIPALVLKKFLHCPYKGLALPPKRFMYYLKKCLPYIKNIFLPYTKKNILALTKTRN